MPRSSQVQREIKQRKPFRSVAQEAVVALLRTADVVRAHFERQLAPHGVTLQQFNVLRILRGAGSDGLPTLEVGARMVERTPGVTRLVDRLVAKGLVERSRSSDDRRVVFCRVSQRGLALLARLESVIAEADESALGALSGPEQEQLIVLLDRARSTHD